MRTVLIVSALGVVVLTGSVMLAAHGQQDRPGLISPAKVWVENRSRNEAVPVVIQDVTTSTPIGVQVIGTPTVALGPAAIVQARLIRQAWEYRTIAIPVADDAARVLSAAGAEGWEATGAQLATPTGTLLVLKRPR
jgi:hypothetical protein